MKLIALSNGGWTKVDDADFDALNQWTWRQQHGYAVRMRQKHEGFGRQQARMHRVILNAPADIDVDHENLDRLDNQRLNLRVATPTQQQANQPIREDNTTGLKGVRFYGMHFRASIQAHGKLLRLGIFRNPADAARAYDASAREIFGEFAHTNAAMHPERLHDWDLLFTFVARANSDRARKWHSYKAPAAIRAMAASIAA